MNQRDLVERAGRGDHDAFAVLVGGSIARLEAVARLILRDPELARDAVQEASSLGSAIHRRTRERKRDANAARNGVVPNELSRRTWIHPS